MTASQSHHSKRGVDPNFPTRHSPEMHHTTPLAPPSLPIIHFLAGILVFLTGCTEQPAHAPSPGEKAPVEAVEKIPETERPPLDFEREGKRPGSHLAVMVTANGMGELEDCGCTLRPLGGLARRVQWIVGHEAIWTSRLVLDAGDLLAEESTLSEDHRSRVLDRAEVILGAHVVAGYDAHALGDRDLALGLDALRRLTGPGRPALLCANTRTPGAPGAEPGSNNNPFQASAVFQRDGIKVGVIGVMGDDFPRRRELEERTGITVTDPVTAVRKEANALRSSGVGILIVLAHAKPETMEAIADEVPGLTAVFGSQTPRETDHPTPIGNTYLADAHEKGKHIGLLGLHIAPNDSAPVFHDPAGRAVLQELQGEVVRRIASRTRAIEGAEEAGRQGNLAWLKKNVVELKTELLEIRLSLGEMTDAPANASVISWDLIPLDTSLPEHPEVQRTVSALLTRHPALRKKKTAPENAPAP